MSAKPRPLDRKPTLAETLRESVVEARTAPELKAWCDILAREVEKLERSAERDRADEAGEARRFTPVDVELATAQRRIADLEQQLERSRDANGQIGAELDHALASIHTEHAVCLRAEAAQLKAETLTTGLLAIELEVIRGLKRAGVFDTEATPSTQEVLDVLRKANG